MCHLGLSQANYTTSISLLVFVTMIYIRNWCPQRLGKLLSFLYIDCLLPFFPTVGSTNYQLELVICYLRMMNPVAVSQIKSIILCFGFWWPMTLLTKLMHKSVLFLKLNIMNFILCSNKITIVPPFIEGTKQL